MREGQIPRIIHYCWFGGAQLPELETKCMKTWKKILPDYEFMFWNEETFDVNSTEWTRTAYELKKYAFVSDYVRVWALEKYGGIYLDTDVRLVKTFDPLLDNEAFFCFEDVAGSIIASCVIGAVPNHPYIQQLMPYYDRAFSMKVIDDNEANVIALTSNLKGHGLELNGKEQILDHAHIYPRSFFCPMDFWGNWDKSDNTYCIHMFSGSWLPDDKLKQHQKRKKWYFRFAKATYGKIKSIPTIAAKCVQWFRSSAMKYIKNIFMEFIYVFYNNFVCYIPSWTIRKALYRLGGMKIGKNSRICMKTVVIKPWRITLGDRTIINEHCHLDGRGGIAIGSDSSISIYSILLTGTHDSHTFEYVEKPINIGDKVWICARSTICPGCKIENKVLVSAGSTLKSGVYTEDMFYSGVPAIPVRERNAQDYEQSTWRPWFR